MTDVASQPAASGASRRTLTDRQGHPIYDNQNQRTVGARGPATLETASVAIRRRSLPRSSRCTCLASR